MRANGFCNGVPDLDASHIQLRIRFDCKKADPALAVASDFDFVNDTRQPKDLAEPRGEQEELPALPEIHGPGATRPCRKLRSTPTAFPTGITIPLTVLL